jgi:putative FmdB family regulatory protein
VPLYDWLCEHCGSAQEVLRPVAQALDPVFCKCGVPMVQQLSPAYVHGDITPYKAVTGDKAGQWITSRQQHKEFLKRNRLVEVGTDKPKPIQQFRSIHNDRTRRDLREQMRAEIRKTLKADTKRGGLIERKPKRTA